ncbi:MAG TPA: hypothetical protein VED40_23080 [Azospirillaceae bacterium]|nr:hypothetical protein [Azospirillaceae bacterium]
MSSYKISFFASGNGDSVLLEAAGTTIMTDIHYCQGHADEDDDSKPDFADTIRKACADDKLDVFVLTHPDKDHVRGAGEIFHLDTPGEWDDDPDDGDPKILIKEIWCSNYAVEQAYETAEAKPLLDEIKRRKELQGTGVEKEDGNRLKILSVDGAEVSGTVGNASWRLLAPTDDEADVPPPAEGQPRESCNRTSLGIQWTVNVYGKNNKILLLGDATVEVLERVKEQFAEAEPSALEWNILLAPHHCSRRSIGRVTNPGKDEEFEESEDALKALSSQLGDGYIVSSSRRFGREKSPPSSCAKNRYLKILARTDNLKLVNDSDRARFLVTGGDTKNAPEHVVFELTARGPSLKKQGKSTSSPALVSAVGGGGSYG